MQDPQKQDESLALYRPVPAVERLAVRLPVRSVRSTTPAAGSTLPRQSCSPARPPLWTLPPPLLLQVQQVQGQSRLPGLEEG